MNWERGAVQCVWGATQRLEGERLLSRGLTEYNGGQHSYVGE